jgi:hypothetical protein
MDGRWRACVVRVRRHSHAVERARGLLHRVGGGHLVARTGGVHVAERNYQAFSMEEEEGKIAYARNEESGQSN